MSSKLAWVVAAWLCWIAACGDNATARGPDRFAIAPASAALEIGETVQLTARFSGGELEVPAGELAWTSSDPARARVTTSGASATITALAAGEATITASGHGLSASATIAISPARLLGIAISPVQPRLAAGTSLQLSAIASYSDGGTADVTAAAVWSSDREVVARAHAGLVTGEIAGEATITARFNGTSSSTRAIVSGAQLASLEIAPGVASIGAGMVQPFTATGTFTDLSTQDLTTQVSWTSSSPAVATIAAGGLATARAGGTTTIEASFGGISDAAELAVRALVSLSISPAAPQLPRSADQPMVATGTFADASTGDISTAVAWSSSDPGVAAISPTGLVDARAVGTTTISAAFGAITDQTPLEVFLAPVGPWTAEPGFAGQRICAQGIALTMASDVVLACTEAAGATRGAITGAAIAWATANTGIDNLAGLAVVTHPQSPLTTMYTGAPAAGAGNWFRSNDQGQSYAAFTLVDSAGDPRAIYTGRFQPMVGNLLGTWDPGGGSPRAVILTGMNPPTSVRMVGTATGTVRAITGSAANNLYAGVLGETPAGAPATGGVFRSTDLGITWTARDGGIADADKPRVGALAIDPTNPLVLYAGLRGGARIYKTSDGGATWAASAAGIPAKAHVLQLVVSPAAPATLFAATTIGLYRSSDAGATWVVAGFQGRAVRALVQSPADPALILAGVDDEVGMYRAM